MSNDQTTVWLEALEAGRFDEAHRLYVLTDAPQPELRRALATLADIEVAVRDKSWVRARRQLDRFEEKPDLVDWDRLDHELELLTKTSGELDRGEPEEALRLLEGLEPRWFAAEAINQRGTAQIQQGDLEAAKGSFSMAVDLDPRHFRALTNLGNAALEGGEVDEAIACYERALALNDEFANAHHNLGVAYRRQGQVGRSVRQLRRAQRFRQREERERTRELVSQGGGEAGLKILRWLLYALIAGVIIALLNRQGLI